MTTFNEMVDHTLSEIASFTKNQQSVTVLTAPITASDLAFSVDDIKSVSKGTVEIGDELVYVSSVSPTYGTATIMPSARGWQGSTAVDHALHTIVRNNPMFPRVSIKRAINEILRSIDLHAISNHEFTFTGAQFAYELPAEVSDITGVSYELPDGTGVWNLLTRWRLDRNYPGTGTNIAIVLNEAPMPGATVRVQYTHKPLELSDGDVFADTGLRASVEDVVRYGAMWKLLSTIDMSKISSTSATGEVIDAQVQAGQSTNIARYIYQIYQSRLAEEKSRQMDDYLQVINYTR